MEGNKKLKKGTLRSKHSLIFALTSVLPLLLFLYVLEEYALIKEQRVIFILGMCLLIAVMGFSFFLGVIKKVNALAQDFKKVEKGELLELGDRDVTSEFSEMAQIADAFNKTLTELKAHTKELQSLVEKITTLSELTEMVARIPDIKEVLKAVLRRTMATVNAKIGSIMLLDEEAQTLRISAAEGLDPSIVETTTIPVGEGIAGKVVQTGEHILVEDIEEDPRFLKANDPKYESSSFICMPLRANWRVMGVLNLSKKGGGKVFREYDLKFLNALLGHIGFALENARLLEDAKLAAEKLKKVVSNQKEQLAQVKKEALHSMKLFHQAQKMEAIGTLAGGIAHDFNNLLTGIQGRISLILADSHQSNHHIEHLHSIEEYVRSESALTKKLLGVALGGKYDIKTTNLNRLIAKSSEMFGRTKKEIKVHTEFQADLWSVDVDQAQMAQVLLNLYVNAWQAMPEGGTLHLKTENARLDMRHVMPYQLEPGEYVKVSVTDTGLGMDQSRLERIFEPFFTTKGMGKGTGLGLASAYGIIKNHKGIIQVSSKEGVGTTFRIYLPASKKKPEEEKEVSSEILRGKENVLLVDDEEMIIEVGENMLSILGYQVIKAKSGDEALTLYQKEKDKIDIVILDMIMPDLSGKETFYKLKEIDPSVKILLSSGYSVDGQATEMIKDGCGGFIQKPFDLTKLSHNLRNVLDNKELPCRLSH